MLFSTVGKFLQAQLRPPLSNGLRIYLFRSSPASMGALTSNVAKFAYCLDIKILLTINQAEYDMIHGVL